MARYASRTKVSAEKSATDIMKVLKRYGAESTMQGHSARAALIAFEMAGRRVKFEMPLPDPDDTEFTLTDIGYERSESAARVAYEQGIKQRWRALLLIITAKLEAVDSGVVTFADEFLAQTMLPNGKSVSDEITHLVTQAYATGKVLPLLPDLSGQ